MDDFVGEEIWQLGIEPYFDLDIGFYRTEIVYINNDNYYELIIRINNNNNDSDSGYGSA